MRGASLAGINNSPDSSTKSTRSTFNGLPLRKHRVSGSFHSPPGFFSPFLHSTMRYRSQGYLALGVVPLLPTRFLVSRGTLDTAGFLSVSSTGFSPSLMCFSKTLRLPIRILYAVLNPRLHAIWFGLFPFRSPLLRKSNRLIESYFFLLLQVLRCFSSLRSLY